MKRRTAAALFAALMTLTCAASRAGAERVEALTWAEFLTMVCSAAAPNTYQGIVERTGLSGAAAAWRTAAAAGFLLPEDCPRLTAHNMDTIPVTRQDAEVLRERILSAGQDVSVSEEDAQTVSEAEETETEETEETEETAAELEETETEPEETGILTREDGETMLARVLDALEERRSGEERGLTVTVRSAKDGTVLFRQSVSGTVGERLGDVAKHAAPAGYRASSLSDGYVSAFRNSYEVYVQPLTEAEREKQDAEAAFRRGEMSEEAYTLADFWLRIQEDNPRKRLQLFGDADWGRYQIYATEEEARANVTAVEVPVWRLRDGERTADTASLTVHRALAEDVREIFTEIFNDPEQFPVESLGGFTYRGGSSTSEHNNGTAIDINPDANYQIRDGVIETGTHWTPEEDPYSVSPTGSVVRVFTEHGWSWGGDAWADSCGAESGYHDYMHFSYRGR